MQIAERFCSLFGRCLFTAAVTLCLAFSGSADAEHLAVYTEQAYPLSYTENPDGSGPVLGFATQLVRAVFEHAEIDYEISVVPWTRAMQEARGVHNVAIYSMTRSPDREKDFHWIGEILPLNYYLYGLKENAGDLPRTLEAAADYRIGVVRSYVLHKYLETLGFDKLVLMNDPARTPLLLERDRIDLFPYNSANVGVFLETLGYDPDDYVGLMPLEEISTGLYIVLSRDTEPALVERVRKAYEYTRSSGLFDAIMGPYIEEARQKPVEILP